MKTGGSLIAYILRRFKKKGRKKKIKSAKRVKSTSEVEPQPTITLKNLKMYFNERSGLELSLYWKSNTFMIHSCCQTFSLSWENYFFELYYTKPDYFVAEIRYLLTDIQN